MRYAIVIEHAETNLSAYVRDLLGCITTDRTVEKVVRNMMEAIEIHPGGMREDGRPIPEPSSSVESPAR